ncbi:Sec14 cytosolic factor [Acrasis kona]|uniref:Sec14 cytosolic factor n=1 Tax=Acrasis kona TaxID=1008807 RepID=A0AAW2Z4F0_9EUKA
MELRLTILIKMTAPDRVSHLRALVSETLSKCSDDEREWCDDQCLNRWLTGIHDMDKCATSLNAALLWRNQYKPHKIPDEEMAPLNKVGKIYVLPNVVDRQGHHVVIIRLCLDSASDGPIEKCIGQYRKNKAVDKVGLIVDLHGVCIGNLDRQLVMDVLKTMQANYVEQLAYSYMVNAPFVFNTFFKIFNVFIDDATKARISVSGTEYKKMLLLKVEESNIPKEYSGTLDYTFDSDKYHEYIKSL